VIGGSWIWSGTASGQRFRRNNYQTLVTPIKFVKNEKGIRTRKLYDFDSILTSTSPSKFQMLKNYVHLSCRTAKARNLIVDHPEDWLYTEYTLTKIYLEYVYKSIHKSPSILNSPHGQYLSKRNIERKQVLFLFKRDLFRNA
jgi:hypothetical protein